MTTSTHRWQGGAHGLRCVVGLAFVWFVASAQNDPLAHYDPDRRLPWSQGTNYAADAIETAIHLGARVIALPAAVPNHPAVSNALVRAGESNVLVICAAANAAVDHDVIADYPTSWRMPHVLTASPGARFWRTD